MKKTILFAAAALALMSFTTKDQASTWSFDKAHGKVGFSITHLMVSDVDGSFKIVDAKMTSAKPDFSDAQVELTADVNSINTDNEQRDAHLRKPDFFDAEKFPKLTFKSKSFKKNGDKKYKVTGDLTMHGITKTVVLDATFRGTTVHPYTKKTVAGFKVTGTIKRSDFAIGKDTPEAVLSDEIVLNANTEFIQD